MKKSAATASSVLGPLLAAMTETCESGLGLIVRFSYLHVHLLSLLSPGWKEHVN